MQQPADGAAFTQEQLLTLRHQIMAYKLLAKNLPLPPQLYQALFPSNGTSGHATGNNSNKLPFDAFASPFQILEQSRRSLPSRHASHVLVPSILPNGMDASMAMVERERRIQTRVTDRIRTLEQMPSNIANRPVTHSAAPNGTTHDAKLQAVIELKALRLLSKQKMLREQVIHAVDRSTTLSTAADRFMFRRLKKQSLREARMTERLERQQRTLREEKETKKHRAYLQTICDHGRALVGFHDDFQARRAKLGRAVLQLHQHVEKEEQKRRERISRERIQALKNDDEEAYMKLIDEAKDTRLTHLLRQTDSFLSSLTLAIADQQGDARDRNAMPTIMDEDEEDETQDVTKTDYFQTTHKIKEEVRQPSILVGGTLKEYQIKGLQWMVSLYNNHLNGILADEMGLGKTIQTISLITYLIEFKHNMGPFLIIVPLSTLPNWTLEFEKWAPSLTKVVYKGNPQVRRALQQDIRQGSFQVLLTTFDFIIKDRPILSKIKWNYLIIDEGHRMKNTNSKLVTVLRQYYSTRFRLILTGTPLQNNLPELWALLNFILPRIFKSVKTFEEWFNTPFSNQGVQDRVGLNEEEQLLIIRRLHKVLRPFLLRRLKKDVESELPDKIERVIKCKLSPLQSKIYSQLKKHGVILTGGGEVGAGGKSSAIKSLNNTIMQLRKVCNHPFVFDEVENDINPDRQSNELLFRVSGKFELLDRMLPKLTQTGHRVLIFFQMTQIMTIMEDFLNYRGFNYLRLDGSTKADDRSLMLKQFNAADSPYTVFLLSTRAGGLGLNLQTADTVIIFDSDWNPHQDLQAQDRAHRIGQTKEVRIYRLVSANSVEEMILARANYKLDLDGKVIQAGKFDNRSTEEDREAFLRSLLEDKDDDQSTNDDEEGLDDEELNQILARADTDFAIFNKMDQERKREDREWWSSLGGYGPVQRLISDKELPDFYNRDQDEVIREQTQDDNEYGRGQRVRDNIRYDDGLTEEQWLEVKTSTNKKNDAVERSEAEADAGKRKRRRGRVSPENNDDDDDDEPSAKRGGARPKVKTKKMRQMDSLNLDGPDTVSPHVRQQMTSVFEQVYQAVLDAREDNGDTYRDLCDLFMELVDKRDFPTYYKLIKDPISLEMINERIHSPHYRNLNMFRDDFDLMFDNARTFNEEGSLVYEDANTLQVKRVKKK
ncbi:SNF2 family N-terminal domain-containing protein [Gongronella butleri]|nr:SNF2 family N-terminal domain-containing protein [Gongronella butleri]